MIHESCHGIDASCHPGHAHYLVVSAGVHMHLFAHPDADCLNEVPETVCSATLAIICVKYWNLAGNHSVQEYLAGGIYCKWHPRMDFSIVHLLMPFFSSLIIMSMSSKTVPYVSTLATCS
jgi:hypothetical protein